MLINQWVPAAHRGDAIGDSARRVRDLLRLMGHESELYALTIDDELKHDVQPFAESAAKRGDLTIFHYALPSPMTAAFASLDSGRILQYHNVTPASFFAPYDPSRGALQALRRRVLSVHLRRPLRRRATVLFDGPRVDDRVPAAQRPLPVHRSGSRRGTRGVLPARGSLSHAQRARGFLRAARRGDGDRRANPRLFGCCSLRHPRRRRRAIRAKGPGAGGGASGRPRLRRRSQGGGDCRPAPAACGLRRGAHQTRSHRAGSATLVRVAFIVQRYGAEVLGGSEHLCRLLGERLAPQHDVEVLTTCARDYITWKNDYPEGSDRIRGVVVRRFANALTRDLNAFNRYSEWIYTHPHNRADEMEWLKQQGPWCPSLIEHLRRHHQQYDVLIFFTYLYAPTVLGLEIAPSRSVLVSTAHDEPAIRLEIFKDVFSRPAALCYLTESERRFVNGQFSERPLIEEVTGVGVETAQNQPYPRMPQAADEDATESTGEAGEAVPREAPSHLLA